MLTMFQTFLLINKKTMQEPIISYAGRLIRKNELKRDVEVMMKALIILGLKPGELLMLHMPLIPEGIVLTFAANALGIRVAYANYEGPEEELREEVVRYSAKVVARYYEAYGDEPAKIHFESGSVNIYLAEYKNLYHLAVTAYVDPRLMRLKTVFTRAPMIFLQTSGSTAVRPKGLPFSNWNIFWSLVYAAKSTGTTTHSTEVKKALCVLNFRHPYGWMPLFVNVMGGNRVELAAGATPEHIAKWYLSEPSYIYGTPQFLREFIARTPADVDLSFLRAFFCAGDSTEEELFAEFAEFCRQHNASQAEIRNNYGAGELLCVGTTSDGIPHRPGASGKFYSGPGLEWLIVDEDLNPVPPGVSGEIIVHSRTMIKEYYQNPEETAKVFRQLNGKTYYLTGDYASLDADGYVYILGRKKRFYQPRGATDKVNCETIEHALLAAHDLVADAGVVIYYLPDKSKSSCAYVVPAPGVAPSADTRRQIMAFLGARLRPFQLPTALEFLDALPMLGSGKVNYPELERLCRSQYPS